MSSIVISGDTSGTLTLSVPAVAGTNTVTLPAASGQLMVSGNMPAFSAYASANQTVANNTAVKIQLNSEVFDTANCFDSTTNYRFTPTVAGYYQINAVVTYYKGTVFTCNTQTKLWKNGTEIKSSYGFGNSANVVGSLIADCIYFNGTTDYLELYTAQSSGGNLDTAANGQIQIFMSGFLARAA